ncbi:MAG: very short patch repair endonuclease [Muribaculum sp.]|nr:very short patch repair endonuclease [Muribaculum sp.]
MDKWSKEQRSSCMAKIKSADTKPELIVRKYLYSRGYRYRKNVKRLPGSPDIVLKKYGIAIFIHGCFWHGHDIHFHLPKSNIEFWQRKITRNKERDIENRERLKKMGWNVLTVWECQLKPSIKKQTLLEIEYFINHSYLSRKSVVKHQPYADNPESLSHVAEPAPPYGVSDREKQ